MGGHAEAETTTSRSTGGRPCSPDQHDRSTMVGPLDVAAALARAARDLGDPQDLDSTLETIITVARDSMAEVDHVGISVGHRDGKAETKAKTDEVVATLDQLQYEFGEGPCLHAMNSGATVTVSHARHDQRW